ncbi:MAG TPA: ankyrin repeat domain-containing protein, partial [Candidatus Angelobacter sp.]|nr:ankyrin repeat domain-containing protein [Candidatus Angelobacter sp.]
AHIDTRDADEETAFLEAAQRGNGLAIMEELVRAGANIHAVNDLGDNAIMLAAWQHHLENVKLLIRLGVDPCAKSNDGETAIDMAKTNLNDDPGKQEIIALLQEKCGR